MIRNCPRFDSSQRQTLLSPEYESARVTSRRPPRNYLIVTDELLDRDAGSTRQQKRMKEEVYSRIVSNNELPYLNPAKLGRFGRAAHRRG